MEDGTSRSLRGLPAVGTLMEAPEVSSLVGVHGRHLVVRAVRQAIDEARERILRGQGGAGVGPEDVARAANVLAKRSLVRAINATGVLLHTNLGRAPLAAAAQEAVAQVAEGYSTLEVELEHGERGSRQRHVADLAARALGAEAAMAVNNCAGATLLMLAALCRGREVIVSRGELVEIGGGFRVPDVMRESGATLVEVGTTNRVYASDYEGAIGERTAALLSVHRSNFALVGFTHSPTVSELAALAHHHGRWLLVDLGSGLLAEDEALGEEAARLVRDEPRPKTTLAEGADVVAISGDKLLGGPQAGILAGRRTLIEQMERHPLARALRLDKLSLAALEATLRLYVDGRADEIPVVAALTEPKEAVEARAKTLSQRVRSASPHLEVETKPAQAAVGGGSLPRAELPTTVLLVGAKGAFSRSLAQELRRMDPPVLARTIDDRLAIDLRTVGEKDLDELADLLCRASAKLAENEYTEGVA